MLGFNFVTGQKAIGQFTLCQTHNCAKAISRLAAIFPE